MVAQLHNDDLQKVVEGSGGPSRGIIACSLQKTDTYDHKRHHAERHTKTAVAEAQFHIWDFVLWRADGSYIAMHPQFSSTKVECKTHWPTFDGELPATGKGGTNGRGTFQGFIKKQVDMTVIFDAHKPTTAAPTRSRGVQNPHAVAAQGKGSASSSPWQ